MSGFGQRLGLAIARPRWALTLASDREHAGRSGSDLLATIVILLAATQLRWLFKAAWLGGVVDITVGLRAAIHVFTRVLTIDLGFLVIAAFVLYAGAGRKRELGRAFDLACVAALPLLFVDLLASTIVNAADLDVPRLVMWGLAGASYAWAGTLVALAWQPIRRSPSKAPVLPGETIRPARIAGWGVVAVALVGIGFEGAWIARNLDLVRPMRSGDLAPPVALATIGPHGELGPKQTLASLRGKIIVVDFWATWCGPCLAAMPKLDILHRKHADIAVLAINLDDARSARALFETRGFSLTLLADDGDASERYGVTTIPHTVLIDRSGKVREVMRGGAARVEAAVEALIAEEIRK